jgi:ketosteroid isomerase-like protein
MSITTTMEQQNVETVRRGFKAFSTGDMQTLTALFHEDAEWHSPAIGVLKESHYRGRDAIFAMFAQLKSETKGTFRPQPVLDAAAGDSVFVRSDVTGERNGRKTQIDEVLIFRLVDGRVKDVRLYLNDPEESARFWS